VIVLLFHAVVAKNRPNCHVVCMTFLETAKTSPLPSEKDLVTAGLIAYFLPRLFIFFYSVSWSRLLGRKRSVPPANLLAIECGARDREPFFIRGSPPFLLWALFFFGGVVVCLGVWGVFVLGGVFWGGFFFFVGFFFWCFFCLGCGVGFWGGFFFFFFFFWGGLFWFPLSSLKLILFSLISPNGFPPSQPRAAALSAHHSL